MSAIVREEFFCKRMIDGEHHTETILCERYKVIISAVKSWNPVQ